MSEEKYDSLSELSIDELIAEARQDLERGTSIPKEPLLPESLPPMEEPFSAQPPVVRRRTLSQILGVPLTITGSLKRRLPQGKRKTFRRRSRSAAGSASSPYLSRWFCIWWSWR